MRLRPGQPNEMCSDVPSHVTSVMTTTTATIAIVRRRGILRSSQLAPINAGRPSGSGLGPRFGEAPATYPTRPRRGSAAPTRTNNETPPLATAKGARARSAPVPVFLVKVRSTLTSDASGASESAAGVGFEPTDELPRQRFSRPHRSAAPAPRRGTKRSPVTRYSTRGGAPNRCSASGTSPWKFSSSASTQRSVAAVPFSVCGVLERLLAGAVADPRAPRLEVRRVRARRQLAVALLRREPAFDVVPLRRRASTGRRPRC